MNVTISKINVYLLFILIESDYFLPIVQQQTDILVDLRAFQIQFHKRKKL